MSEKRFYYFTNHRRLVQFLTKGYLCNPDYWDEKTKDYSKNIDFPFTEHLFFSTNLFNLPYTFNSDKTLTPVAFGFSGNNLENLGFKPVDIPDAGPVYFGDEIIPIDLVEIILFRSEDEYANIKLRLTDYIHLLTPDKYVVSKKKEFEALIQIPEKLEVELPPIKLSNLIETKISKRVGSVGNYLINLIESKDIKILLFSDIIFSYLNNPSINDSFDTIIKNIQDVMPVWDIEHDEVLLIAALFISNSVEGIDNQINRISDFAKDTSINIQDHDFDLLFTFLKTLNTVFFSINEEIKIMDRVDLLLKIEKELKKDIKKRHLNGKKVLLIIEKIKGVFDYNNELSDVISEIDKLGPKVLKYFIKGFELYSREPVHLDKLKKAIDKESDLSFSVYKAIPIFIWGLSRGAFSFNPVSKGNMLKQVHNKKLCNMAFSKKELKDYNFNLLPDKKFENVHGAKEIKFGDYEIYFKPNDPIEKSTYEIIPYDIFTKSGLSIKEEIKDEYLNVQERINDIISNKKPLDEKDIEFFIIQKFKSDIELSLGSENFKVKNKPKITVGEDITIQYAGDFNIDICMPKADFADKLMKLLNDSYGDSNFKNITLQEKRILRDHFSMDGSSKKSVPKVENDSIRDINPDPSVPSENSSVKEMKKWLKAHNTPAFSRLIKSELLDLIRDTVERESKEITIDFK